MCPDWESNWRPFGSQAGTQSTEPHQPGHRNLTFNHAFLVVPGYLIPLLGRDILSALGTTIILGTLAIEDNEPSLLCLMANLISHSEPEINNVAECILVQVNRQGMGN